jgi:transposase
MRRGQAVAGQSNRGKIADNHIDRRIATVLAGYDSHPTAACASKDRGQCRCDVVAGLVGVFAAMIAPPSNTQIWIAAGVTDLRRGFTGLSALVQVKLEQSPMSGHVFVFRGRRGDLIKVIWFDGDGLCLFSKRLERGRFVWPQATSGSVALTRAQLSMLLEGIDWRRPERTWDRHAVV